MPQNSNSPLICGKPEVVLGGNFWWGMEDLQRDFHPSKYGKDRIKTGGEIKGTILGYEISDITYPTMHG